VSVDAHALLRVERFLVPVVVPMVVMARLHHRVCICRGPDAPLNFPAPQRSEERSPPATDVAPRGPVLGTKRGRSGTDTGEAQKAAKGKDRARSGEEAEQKRTKTLAAPSEAAARTVPTHLAPETQATAPPPSTPPCDTNLLQAVADRLLTAANAGLLERRGASKAALELTSLKLARDPGGRARLVVRARAIDNLLDDGDYQGLEEWLGD
jgi:hypothetical protein